jgi:HEAT repeat protein
MKPVADRYAQVRAAFASHHETVSRAMLAGLSPGDDAVIRRLWLEETKPSIRRWVVEAAGAAKGRWATTVIRQALQDSAMTVRLHALLAIGSRRDRRLAAATLPLAGDPSGGIRTNCLALLIDLKPQGWRTAVEAGLEDPKSYVRSQCTKALAATDSGTTPAKPRRKKPGARR